MSSGFGKLGVRPSWEDNDEDDDEDDDDNDEDKGEGGR